MRCERCKKNGQLFLTDGAMFCGRCATALRPAAYIGPTVTVAAWAVVLGVVVAGVLALVAAGILLRDYLREQQPTRNTATYLPGAGGTTGTGGACAPMPMTGCGWAGAERLATPGLENDRPPSNCIV